MNLLLRYCLVEETDSKSNYDVCVKYVVKLPYFCCLMFYDSALLCCNPSFWIVFVVYIPV